MNTGMSEKRTILPVCKEIHSRPFERHCLLLQHVANISSKESCSLVISLYQHLESRAFQRTFFSPILSPPPRQNNALAVDFRSSGLFLY